MCSWADPATGENKLIVVISQVADGERKATELREMVMARNAARQAIVDAIAAIDDFQNSSISTNIAVDDVVVIDTDLPGFTIPWTLIASLAIATAVFVFVVVRMAIRARQRPVVSGVTSLVGADGEMLDDATGTGWANIRGETWQVKTNGRVTRGQKVRVVAVDGVIPRVAPASDA